MSRSYKHNPICTDRPHGAKYWKRQANHKVRRTLEIPNGKAYRKVYNPWEIHDFICRESKYDAMFWYNSHKKTYYYGHFYKEYPTFEDYMNKCWAHDFYRK